LAGGNHDRKVLFSGKDRHAGNNEQTRRFECKTTSRNVDKITFLLVFQWINRFPLCQLAVFGDEKYLFEKNTLLKSLQLTWSGLHGLH